MKGTRRVKRVGILTGGGDCPGLNAVIRAVAKSLISQYDVKVMGIEDGFAGLVEKRIRPLSYDDVSGIIQIGGTILGASNRANPFQYPVELDSGKTAVQDLSDRVVNNALEFGLEAVVCMGGDGSLTIAHGLAKKGMKIIGVPKTIDNDIVGTDISFGHDTAVTIATEAIDRIHTTAQSHHRVMIVEVMGRYAGWLALRAGLAGGADIILIPEAGYDLDVVCERVIERSRRGRRFSIIAAAEGVPPPGGKSETCRRKDKSREFFRLGGVGIRLAEEIEKRTGLETRATILGHLQRGGTPTPFDRILATRFGVAAAEMVSRREFGKMVALQGGSIVSVPVSAAAGKMKKVPLNDPLLKAARYVGTSLGVRD